MRQLCAFALPAVLLTAAPARAAETATAAVVVQVEVSSRTSLRVSTDLLRFTVRDDARPATATVDFSAGARVQPGADLLLTVEALPAATGSELASRASITLDDGLALAPSQPAVAARWHGSGRRSGRLVFTLHGAEAGAHELPVRFVLSTP